MMHLIIIMQMPMVDVDPSMCPRNVNVLSYVHGLKSKPFYIPPHFLNSWVFTLGRLCLHGTALSGGLIGQNLPCSPDS
jgi:hypothetical protein